MTRSPQHLSATLIALLTLAPLLSTGCFPETYQVQRSALVAPPAPPQWTGTVHRGGVGLGDSTVVWHSAPHRSEESDSGLYVARTQLEGKAHLGIGKHVSLWAPMSYGVSAGALQTTGCLVEKPDQGVLTSGVGVGVAGALSPTVDLSFATELQLSSVPSRIITRCITCPTSNITEEQDNTIVGVFSASLLMGKQLGDSVRLYGGAAMRNQPSNTRNAVVTTALAPDFDGEVDGGIYYVMPTIGLEVDLSDTFSAAAQLYQPLPLGAEDLVYGPVVGLSINLHVPTTPAPTRQKRMEEIRRDKRTAPHKGAAQGRHQLLDAEEFYLED